MADERVVRAPKLLRRLSFYPQQIRPRRHSLSPFSTEPTHNRPRFCLFATTRHQTKRPPPPRVGVIRQPPPPPFFQHVDPQMPPFRPPFFRTAALAVTLMLIASVHADSQPACSVVGAACCPRGAPGAPTTSPYKDRPFCAGDDVICYSASPNPVCQPYPRDCGGSGQACCPGSYHQIVDKRLPPRCASSNDWCNGKVCATNPPDCGELGKEPCWSGGDASTQSSCKTGPDGVKLGLANRQAKVCGVCPDGMHVGNNGASLCVA